ncbi:hypothetical protein P7C73_g928, partial [Tremellales sp. Uapishka_1]
MPRTTADARMARAFLAAPYPLPHFISRNEHMSKHRSPPLPQFFFTPKALPPPTAVNDFPSASTSKPIEPAFPPIPYPDKAKKWSVRLSKWDKEGGEASEIELMSGIEEQPIGEELNTIRELGKWSTTRIEDPQDTSTPKPNLLTSVFETTIPRSYVDPDYARESKAAKVESLRLLDPNSEHVQPHRWLGSRPRKYDYASSVSSGGDTSSEGEADEEDASEGQSPPSQLLQTPLSRRSQKGKTPRRPLFIGDTHLLPFTYADTRRRQSQTSQSTVAALNYMSEATSIRTITRIPRSRYRRQPEIFRSKKTRVKVTAKPQLGTDSTPKARPTQLPVPEDDTPTKTSKRAHITRPDSSHGSTVYHTPLQHIQPFPHQNNLSSRPHSGFGPPSNHTLTPRHELPSFHFHAATPQWEAGSFGLPTPNARTHTPLPALNSGDSRVPLASYTFPSSPLNERPSQPLIPYDQSSTNQSPHPTTFYNHSTPPQPSRIQQQQYPLGSNSLQTPQNSLYSYPTPSQTFPAAHFQSSFPPPTPLNHINQNLTVNHPPLFHTLSAIPETSPYSIGVPMSIDPMSSGDSLRPSWPHPLDPRESGTRTPRPVDQSSRMDICEEESPHSHLPSSFGLDLLSPSRQTEQPIAKLCQTAFMQRRKMSQRRKKFAHDHRTRLAAQSAAVSQVRRVVAEVSQMSARQRPNPSPMLLDSPSPTHQRLPPPRPPQPPQQQPQNTIPIRNVSSIARVEEPRPPRKRRRSLSPSSVVELPSRYITSPVPTRQSPIPVPQRVLLPPADITTKPMARPWHIDEPTALSSFSLALAQTIHSVDPEVAEVERNVRREAWLEGEQRRIREIDRTMKRGKGRMEERRV